MNNTFNLQRFLLLFKKHTTEHIKTYLLSAAVLFGLTVLFLIFSVIIDNNLLPSGTQIGIFFWILLLGGSIFTSLTFNSLGNKRESITTLTLPASQLEKFLVQWIYSFLIFQLIFLFVFFLADGIILTLYPSGKDSYGLIQQNKMITLSTDSGRPYVALVFYALFHGIAIFGAIFFEKLHIIKTAFTFLIGFLLLIVINQPFLTLLTGRTFASNTFPFGAISFTDYKYHNMFVQIEASDKPLNSSVWALIITVLLLWLGAFYRLKEKQV